MKRTLVSVAHAGGQGKTTVAQLLRIAGVRAYEDYKFVAADFQDELGRSKLGRLYQDRVEEFGVGAPIVAARVENNINAGVRYWDRLGHVFLRGGYIVDVGANVFKSLVDWAHDRNVAHLMERSSAPKVDFFCITRAESHAMDDAVALVSKLVKDRPFDIGRVFVVQNEVGGPFEPNRLTSKLGRIQGLRVEEITLPRCNSEIWPAMEAKGVSLEEAAAFDVDQTASRLDVDIWTASGGLNELNEWIDRCCAAFTEAGVFRSDGTTRLGIRRPGEAA